MNEVRRPGDNELCGQVERRCGRWYALTVFGAVLGEHGRRVDAVDQVLGEGLESLAQRWTLHQFATGTEEIVCILEASTAGVTVARDYYATPGVPTLSITAQQLTQGEWEMRR